MLNSFVLGKDKYTLTNYRCYSSMVVTNPSHPPMVAPTPMRLTSRVANKPDGKKKIIIFYIIATVDGAYQNVEKKFFS